MSEFVDRENSPGHRILHDYFTMKHRKLTFGKAANNEMAARGLDQIVRESYNIDPKKKKALIKDSGRRLQNSKSLVANLSRQRTNSQYDSGMLNSPLQTSASKLLENSTTMFASAKNAQILG